MFKEFEKEFITMQELIERWEDICVDGFYLDYGAIINLINNNQLFPYVVNGFTLSKGKAEIKYLKYANPLYGIIDEEKIYFKSDDIANFEHENKIFELDYLSHDFIKQSKKELSNNIKNVLSNFEDTPNNKHDSEFTTKKPNKAIEVRQDNSIASWQEALQPAFQIVFTKIVQSKPEELTENTLKTILEKEGITLNSRQLAFFKKCFPVGFLKQTPGAKPQSAHNVKTQD